MSSRTKTESTMSMNFQEMPNGYLETIQLGINGLQHFSLPFSRRAGTLEENLKRLRSEIETSDAILIGAGAGLSTSAGYTYAGERFERYFFDFAKVYGIRDIYSGGFYPFPNEMIRWAWWARSIYFNRYTKTPKPVYEKLLELVKDKDYFVITTNVDHCFQKAGFDKKRLFYTQGDYGLFQSINPKKQKTYDNKIWVMQAMETQGFMRNENGVFDVPADRKIAMKIPAELIPKCPDDGSDVTMNLRADDFFVEDEGWRRASATYSDFLHQHENMHVLYLELGVGTNTPAIVKYPFWQMTWRNERAVYGCINYGDTFCPGEIKGRSICVDGDIAVVLEKLKD